MNWFVKSKKMLNLKERTEKEEMLPVVPVYDYTSIICYNTSEYLP